MNPGALRSASVIDLFAGVGGLSLGACRAGFNLRLSVEKDPFAFAAHSANFPGTRHSNDDISCLTGENLLDKAGLQNNELCGLIGGPPCQGFSSMGHRLVDDGRNELFRKFFALVRETRPKFFLAENVPGILSPCYRALIEEALSDLNGYTILEPFKVCAADFGAPTSRTRVLFFGYLTDELSPITANDFSPPKTVARVNVGTALIGLPIKIKKSWNTDENGWRKVRSEIKGEFGERSYGKIPDGVGEATSIEIWKNMRRTSGCMSTDHEEKTIRRFDALEPGEIDRVSRGVRLDVKGLCPTLRAGTASDRGSYQAVRPIHPTEPRVITPREAARLQGFPDWFRFDRTKWHSFRQIGNSVSPILAETVLGIVKSKLNAA